MIGLPKEFYSPNHENEEGMVVGVQYFKAARDHPPMRIFYPAERKKSASPTIRRGIRWFEDTTDGCLTFLKGYAHVSLCRKHTRTFRYFLVPFLSVFSWFFPLRWLRIPGVYKDAAPIRLLQKHDKNEDADSEEEERKKKELLPLILFSHGLTGTGQENNVLCAQWARHGFVVASVHHTDGSSCCVMLEDGSELYYAHGPPLTDYDPMFRPRQVDKRAGELIQVHNFLFKGAPLEIRKLVDPGLALVAGFSYGAATAARAVTMEKYMFRGALFLDGWFRIDVTESAGVAFNMPKEAFEKKAFPPNFPIMFINSEQFKNYTPLFKATEELAGEYKGKIHVILGTGHQNFCDVVFWLPFFLLRKLMMGMVGPTDPVKAYKEIIDLSTDFFKNTLQI